MEKKKCFYCGRQIAENNLTGSLRPHKWPADREDVPFFWMNAGDKCPGTGTQGS